MLQNLKSIFGNKCAGIKVNGNEYHWKYQEQVRFCEAVNYSFTKNILITSDNISCMGAKRNFWELLTDEQLAERISENRGIKKEFVKKLLAQIPKMKEHPQNIVMGDIENPDIYIVYTTPAKGMELIYLYAKNEAQSPAIAPISILSICGSIFIQTYLTRKISLSFGCPESRDFGGLEQNEIVVGIPAELAGTFSKDDFSY